MLKWLRSKSGFTLIELMAVVVVIGIASGMAAPVFDRALQRLRFRGETKNLLSTLRTARSYAISKKDPYGVYIDGNNFTVTLFKDIANLNDHTFEMGDSVVRVDTMSYDIVYLFSTFPGSAVIYEPNGTSSGTGYIYMMSDNSSVINLSQLHVLASTGRSRVNYIHNY